MCIRDSFGTAGEVMPNIKQTERKERPATFECHICGRHIKQRYGRVRHLGTQHGVDEYGNPVSPRTLARYESYNKKRPTFRQHPLRNRKRRSPPSLRLRSLSRQNM